MPLNSTSARVGPTLTHTPDAETEAARREDSRTSVRPARRRSLRAICRTRSRSCADGAPSLSACFAASRATASSASGTSSPSCGYAAKAQSNATSNPKVRTTAHCITRVDGPAMRNFNGRSARTQHPRADLQKSRLGRWRRGHGGAAYGVPFVEWNRGERLDNRGIELGPCAPQNLGAGVLRTALIAEGPGVRDRLVRLGDVKGPGPPVDLVPAETERITVPVPSLVVLDDDPARLLEVRNPCEQPVAELRMTLHLLPVFGRQRRPLAQQGIGNADLAHVVEERALLDGEEGVLVETCLESQANGPGGDLARMGLLGAALVERRDEAVDEVPGPLVDPSLERLVQRFQRRVLAVQEGRHLLVVAAQVVLVGGAANDLQEVALVPRLGDEAEDLAAIDGVDGGLEFLDGGDEQPVALRRDLARTLQELGPVHLRHPVVAADDHELAPAAEDLEGFGGTGGGDDLVSLELESALERFEHERLVVDEEQAIHRTPAIGRGTRDLSPEDLLGAHGGGIPTFAHPHRLHVDELAQADRRELAAVPRRLHPAEGQPRVGLDHAVDEDLPRPEVVREPLDLLRIPRPRARSQAEPGRVGERDRLADVLGAEHGRHGSEDLLVAARSARPRVGEDRRLEEEPIAGDPLAAGEHLRPRRHHLPYLRFQVLEHLGGGEGADLGLRIARIAEAQGLHPCRHPLRELVVDVAMDDEALGRDTALAGVLDACGHGGLDGLVEVRAGEDDVRVATTQLEDDFLEIATTCLADATARALAARQRGGGDARVLQDLRNLVAPDEERLERAFREAGLRDEIFHRERALRDVRGVLEEPDVARGERGCREADHLPEREVPGHHGQHDAEGLVAHERTACVGLHHLVGDEARAVLGIEPAAESALVHLGERGAVELAHLEGHQLCQLFASL